METKVINFFAGPGAGKSTIATGVFAAMKRKGINSEYIPEYAKELAWKQDLVGLRDQFHVFGEQHFRQSSMIGKVDYLICDSPLILSVLYAPGHFPKSFEETVWWAFNQYDNVNFLVTRRENFLQAGRIHNWQESLQKDHEVRELLDFGGVDYHRTSTDGDHISDVFKVLGI